MNTLISEQNPLRLRVRLKTVIAGLVGIIGVTGAFVSVYANIIAAIGTLITYITVSIALMTHYSTSLAEYQADINEAHIELASLHSIDYQYEIDIQTFEAEKTSEENALAEIEKRISGINVNIAHEQSNIDYCNRMLSQQLSGSTADHWIEKRKRHRQELARWQQELSNADQDKAMKESSIESLESKIFSKKIDRSLNQEEISRVSSNIEAWREKETFILQCLSAEAAKLVELVNELQGLRDQRTRLENRIRAINTELQDETLSPDKREQLKTERGNLIEILYGP